MNTPTPRTDAAWAKTFQDDEDQCRAGNAATDMRDECATLERELAALAAERDQLRAALALGQQNCDDAYDDLRAERAAAIARAESAEREAFDWKKIARYEAARAERAEAELAFQVARNSDLFTQRDQIRAELDAERARLDWLEENAKDIMKYNCRSYIWFAHQNIRAAIDAATTEDAK